MHAHKACCLWCGAFSLLTSLAAVWDKLVEPTPAPASVTISDVLNASTESHGHSDAFGAAGVEDEFLWDFPMMRYVVRGFGAGLVDLGHKYGSKYATWGQAGPETVALALAGAQVGAVNVHLPADATPEEVAAVVQDEQVRTLYFQERIGQRDLFEEVVSTFAPNAHAGESCALSWFALGFPTRSPPTPQETKSTG